MSQRIQSLLFFVTAVAMCLLLFAPLAEFAGEANMWKFNVYGVASVVPNDVVPFSRFYVLPLLVVTVVALLLAFYVATSLFRAVNIKQFSRLLAISRITTAVIVAWIATAFAYYVPAIMNTMPNIYPDSPSYEWGIFMPLVALISNIVASFGLKSDLVKVRSSNRIR